MFGKILDIKMYEFMKQLTPLDVEEFFVLILLERITPIAIYARSDFVWCRSFYDFYKDQSLFEVLSEIGLTESDLQTEALRFIRRLWMPLMSTVF